MKVLAGEGNFDSDVEDKEDRVQLGSKAKREGKAAAKASTDGRDKVTTISKVGKLVSKTPRYFSMLISFSLCRDSKKVVSPCLPSMRFILASMQL